VDCDVAGECAVDWGCGEELDVRAQVVAPGPTFTATATRDAGLERHAIADRVAGHLLRHLDDHAGRFVAQDDSRANLVLTDPAVLVIVDVGAADTDGAQLDQQIVCAELG
jgi:hypothetical protein